MAENVTYELFQMVKEDNAKTAKLRAEIETLQKECEEQNASRCELIQENADLRKMLERFVASFETFNGSLGKSMQGWDYPRLHRVREEAEQLLARAALKD